MNKKEQLINWAREKFENDKDGMITITVVSKERWEWGEQPYTINSNYDFKNLIDFLIELELYDDNLNEIPEDEDDWDENEDEYEAYGIWRNSLGISKWFWTSSEDIKYFKEN